MEIIGYGGWSGNFFLLANRRGKYKDRGARMKGTPQGRRRNLLLNNGFLGLTISQIYYIVIMCISALFRVYALKIVKVW